MHRTHRGRFRVRIEARHEWVDPGDFWKASLTNQRERCDRAIRIHKAGVWGKGDVNITYEKKWPAAAGNLIPLSRSPQRGKAGAGRCPPRRWHAARQQKALVPIDAAAPPARGFQSAPLNPPCASPRMGASAASKWSASICGTEREKK
jgi:hypothetical protein